MMLMVIKKVYFRPTRSPSLPNTSAPKGRTAKPAANAARANMKPVVSFTPEKNWPLMMTASRP